MVLFLSRIPVNPTDTKLPGDRPVGKGNLRKNGCRPEHRPGGTLESDLITVTLILVYQRLHDATIRPSPLPAAALCDRLSGSISSSVSPRGRANMAVGGGAG